MWKAHLEVESNAVDGRTRVYALTGNLFGSADAYAFQDEVRKRLSEGTKRLVIDLSKVEKIDSSGIGILVAIMWSASRAGGGMVLAALPDRVEKILEIAMLLDHIDHAETVEAALARLDEMGSGE